VSEAGLILEKSIGSQLGWGWHSELGVEKILGHEASWNFGAVIGHDEKGKGAMSKLTGTGHWKLSVEWKNSGRESNLLHQSKASRAIG